MRLKPIGILVIVGIIALLLYMLVKPKFSSTGNNTTIPSTDPFGKQSNTTQSEGDWENNDSEKETASPSADEPAKPAMERREFNYTPEKPQSPKLKGVVELGASGFNSFVINMDSKNRWEIVSKDFGESLAYEGLATTEDIRAGLKKYIAGMFDKGVSKTDMHFVISSGAQKEPKTKIISNELKKMGYVVNNVTPEQEAQYALKSTLPASYADNSFVIDIGSGNTKVSWDDNGTLRSLELPGAKYYEKGVSDEEVYSQVKSAISKIPEDKRNVAFILGGVPYTLAKQTRNGEERYTVLNNPDTYKAADKKMASGLNIYKAFVDGTSTDTFVFDWDSNFTIGFLLGLNQ